MAYAEKKHLAKKSTKRLKIIRSISDVITNDRIFSEINIQNMSEAKIMGFMKRYLEEGLEELFKEISPSLKQSAYERKANKALVWGPDPTNFIPAVNLFGTRNIADYLVNIEGMQIALEVERGEDGKSVRDGLGQSLVYSTDYDFVIYLLIDVTKEEKILKSLENIKEQRLIGSLWENHNVLLVVRSRKDRFLGIA